LTNGTKYAIINTERKKEVMKMKIYKLVWTKIDWSAYYGLGYNYVEDNGVIYATTKEKVKAACPITEQEGKIEVTEIKVIE
jgi:hypothetical protein